MEENLHLKWCRLRQHPNQRRLYSFSVKSLLNLASSMNIENCEVLFSEWVGSYLIDELVFLAVQCQWDGCGPSLAYLVSPQFSQALQPEEQKDGEEN